MAKFNKNYSPNFSLPKRSKNRIKYIILHYTGMKKEFLAIKRLCDHNSKVSAHYFIKRNGELINLIPELYEAWHAGKSNWKKIKSLNKYSIGVEIQNQGHNFRYEKYSYKQIRTLKKLLKRIIKKYKINLNNVLGHSDISPERKKDPGEKFPWKNLAKFNLVKWHKLSEKETAKYRLKKLNQFEETSFIKNLYIIGYNNIKKLKPHLNRKYLIIAFQRRFRQSLINGKSDQECLLISKNLINS